MPPHPYRESYPVCMERSLPLWCIHRCLTPAGHSLYMVYISLLFVCLFSIILLCTSVVYQLEVSAPSVQLLSLMESVGWRFNTLPVCSMTSQLYLCDVISCSFFLFHRKPGQTTLKLWILPFFVNDLWNFALLSRLDPWEDDLEDESIDAKVMDLLAVSMDNFRVI